MYHISDHASNKAFSADNEKPSLKVAQGQPAPEQEGNASASNCEPKKSRIQARRLRQRQNRKLKNLLVPKQPVESLQELKGTSNNNMGADGGFMTAATEDFVLHEGYNQAAENPADEQRVLLNLGQSLLMVNFNEQLGAATEGNE